MASKYAQTSYAEVGRVYWAMVRDGLFDSEGKPKVGSAHGRQSK